MFTLEISKEFCRGHQTIKDFENITMLRNKGKGFKNLLPDNECKLKRVIVKQTLDQNSDLGKAKNEESRTKNVEYFVDWDQ